MIMERKLLRKRPESILLRMERMLAGAVTGREREAEDLVYDSWETADDDTAYDLLEQAVELDPTNVDAWLGLMDFERMADDERIDMLRRLVALGKQNLGEKTFRECQGHFWGLLETRPYMRARAQLAYLLMEQGRFEASIVEYEGMLKLNPNDNQGVRYELMACYLASGRLDKARRLFVDYDERQFSTAWAWAYVLERFISGALPEATEALRSAQKLNYHARIYFLGDRKLPRTLPSSYSRGTKEDAIIAWDIMRHAWEKHPAAQAWLRSHKSAAKAR